MFEKTTHLKKEDGKPGEPVKPGKGQANKMAKGGRPKKRGNGALHPGPYSRMICTGIQFKGTGMIHDIPKFIYPI